MKICINKYAVFSLILFLVGCSPLMLWQKKEKPVHIFSSFRGNGEDGLHLAYSYDGLNWTAINQDKSVLQPEVGGKLMRDPCIIRGPEGVFHMVWTSSWQDGGIGIAHSKDLINWSEQTFIPTMADYPTARNAWAPEIFYDEHQQQYIIYWASTIPGKYPQTEEKADKGWDHRIYATTTRDFVSYSDTFLFFQPDFNVIDSTLIKEGEEYLMILKDETRYPPAKNLKVARSLSLDGPWVVEDKPFSPENLWVEGPTMAAIDGWYYVYFDAYIEHNYGVVKTRDFKNWQDVSHQLKMPIGMRHGSVLTISENVRPLMDKLLALGN
ncbi:glycoside hydrolase family 43 protein [Catenovulum sediminis]|uniref:Glycoside hydrolase family 43 protein n=1 Tax=Catenovulum sediminis TaxID=1740262 RepID=A0ABV1RED8_9ALTE|nr:glycoside hydrolase family 43 protein [Catenovulum sediminis]